jgi:hypothetical protein
MGFTDSSSSSSSSSLSVSVPSYSSSSLASYSYLAYRPLFLIFVYSAALIAAALLKPRPDSATAKVLCPFSTVLGEAFKFALTIRFLLKVSVV